MFRKSRRKGLAIVAAGALVIGLASCSGGTNDDAPDGSTPSEVTIGFVGSLTGPLAASGINQLEGLKAGAAYAESLHKGLAVKILERDTAGEATAAVAQTRALAQEGVTSMYFSTEAFPAVQGVLNEIKIPGATSGGIAAVLADVGDSHKYKYAFSTAAGNAGPTAITPLLDHAVKFGNKIGMIDDSSAFAVAQAKQTEAIVAKDYPNVELVRVSFAAAASDVTAQIGALRDAGVDAVVSWPYGTAAVTIMAGFDKLGWYPPVSSILGLGTPAIIQVIPKEIQQTLAAGPMARTFLDPALDKTGIVAEFVTRYLKAVNRTEFTPLDTVGATSFDWAVLIAQAVVDAGTVNGDAIKKYLTSGAKFVGANGTYTFGSDERIGIDASQLAMFRPAEPCTGDGYCVPYQE